MDTLPSSTGWYPAIKRQKPSRNWVCFTYIVRVEQQQHMIGVPENMNNSHWVQVIRAFFGFLWKTKCSVEMNPAKFHVTLRKNHVDNVPSNESECFTFLFADRKTSNGDVCSSRWTAGASRSTQTSSSGECRADVLSLMSGTLALSPEEAKVKALSGLAGGHRCS